MNLPKMHFKDNSDMINGVLEVDESVPLKE